MAFTYGSNGTVKLGSGSESSYYQCRLGYQVNSQSIENNTSNITLRLEVRSINSSYSTYGYNQTTKIDGTSLGSKAFDMRSTNTWQVFGERTITVYHNAEGKYSANKSGSFTTTASGTYSLKSGSASVTVAPPDIARASQPSLITWPDTTQNVTIGDTITIHMNRVSDNFVHTVRYVWGDKSGVIGNDVTNNCNWTIPMDFCDNIPSSTSGTGIVYVDTYSNGNHVGTKSVNFTGFVPDWVIPNIGDINITDANSHSAGLGALVQSKSSLNVNIGTWGSYSSWITSCRVDGIDNNVYWSTNFTSAVLQIAGYRTITVTVTDSRGRVAQKQVNYNCIPYSNPTIYEAYVVRCNHDGSNNEDGVYVKYTFKGAIASVDGRNTRDFKLGYKKKTDNEYTYIGLDNSNYELNIVDSVINWIEFDTNSSYDFQFYIHDYFAPSTIIRSVGSGFTLFDVNETGKGFAFGKVSEKNALEIALPTEFTNTVNGRDIEDFVKYRGYYYNVDECLMNGYYLVNPTSINLPPVDEEWKKYGVIIVETTATVFNHEDTGEWIWQTFKNTTGETWTRNAINDGWTAWQKFKSHTSESADIAERTRPLGVYSPESGGTHIGLEGLSMTQAYNSGHPAQFGNILNLRGGGGGGSSQLCMEWMGYTATGNIWYRSLRDFTGDGTTWGPWLGLVLHREGNVVSNDPDTSSFVVYGPLVFCWGCARVIVESANTPASTYVTFPRGFSATPTITVTPQSGVPGTQMLGTGISETSSGGFRVHVTRTNTTTTSIMWMAIGPA